MKIFKSGTKWYCSEVILNETLGYGKYILYVASRVDQLDKNIVAGLFTWTDQPAYNHREIDIEFSRWGITTNDNAQYVVQPYTHSGNVNRFYMELTGDYSTHLFNWRTNRIFFKSLLGHNPSPPEDSSIIESWVYTGDDIPPTGDENVRINFWLYRGNPPSDGQEAELIIKKFEFIPDGDINGDGKFNWDDVIYLAKHFYGPDLFPDYETVYADKDIDCNGQFNWEDVIYLAKYYYGPDLFPGYEILYPCNT